MYLKRKTSMKQQRSFVMASGKTNTSFFVRGTGHFVIAENELPKMASHGEIFWCVSGSATFIFENKKYILHPNEIFYYPPNSFHDISINGKIFNYHWLSIDGPEAGFLFKALGYKPGIIEAGNPPENLFSSLELYLQNNIKEYQIKALDTAFQILTSAFIPKITARPILEQIKDFIDENYWQHKIDVSFLADSFQMHRVSLTRQFQDYFGISPGKYLASVRIQNGIKLLQSTDLSIKEIASKCGFSSGDYFTKSIKKIVKLSIDELRMKK